MPLEECFREFTHPEIPPIIYTDTSFFIEALVNGQKYQKESIDFIEKLADTPDQPIIVFSELLKPELRCAIISICLRNEKGPWIKVKEEIYKDPDCIKKYYQEAIEAEARLFDILQRFKHWASIPVDEGITKRSHEIMPKYRLGSYDALHVATMEQWEIKDVVVFDWGIEDLPKYKPDCYIWTCGGWEKYKKRIKKRAYIK